MYDATVLEVFNWLDCKIGKLLRIDLYLCVAFHIGSKDVHEFAPITAIFFKTAVVRDKAQKIWRKTFGMLEESMDDDPIGKTHHKHLPKPNRR